MKKFLIIAMAAALIISVATVAFLCYLNADLNVREDKDEQALQQLKQIDKTTTIEDILALLGDPIPSEMSGFIVNRRELANGDYIQFLFDTIDGKVCVTGYLIE